MNKKLEKEKIPEPKEYSIKETAFSPKQEGEKFCERIEGENILDEKEKREIIQQATEQEEELKKIDDEAVSEVCDEVSSQLIGRSELSKEEIEGSADRAVESFFDKIKETIFLPSKKIRQLKRSTKRKIMLLLIIAIGLEAGVVATGKAKKIDDAARDATRDMPTMMALSETKEERAKHLENIYNVSAQLLTETQVKIREGKILQDDYEELKNRMMGDENSLLNASNNIRAKLKTLEKDSEEYNQAVNDIKQINAELVKYRKTIISIGNAFEKQGNYEMAAQIFGFSADLFAQEIEGRKTDNPEIECAFCSDQPISIIEDGYKGLIKRSADTYVKMAKESEGEKVIEYMRHADDDYTKIDNYSSAGKSFWDVAEYFRKKGGENNDLIRPMYIKAGEYYIKTASELEEKNAKTNYEQQAKESFMRAWLRKSIEDQKNNPFLALQIKIKDYQNLSDSELVIYMKIWNHLLRESSQTPNKDGYEMQQIFQTLPDEKRELLTGEALTEIGDKKYEFPFDKYSYTYDGKEYAFVEKGTVKPMDAICDRTFYRLFTKEKMHGGGKQEFTSIKILKDAPKSDPTNSGFWELTLELVEELRVLDIDLERAKRLWWNEYVPKMAKANNKERQKFVSKYMNTVKQYAKRN